MRTEFRRPVLWLILAGIGLVLAMAGAFGTAGVLRPIPLGLYWIVMVVLTYATGNVVSTLLRRALPSASRPLRILVVGVVTGLAVCLVVLGVNLAVFGSFLDGPSEWVEFLATALAVTMVVTTVLDLAFAESAARTDTLTGAPALLDRLPFEKRGTLLAISVEDHYVRVRTTHGEEMILMRLGDAIRETDPAPGLQIHRSHWVALDAVVAATRDGDRARLTLSDGTELPVARGRMADIRAAGLI